MDPLFVNTVFYAVLDSLGIAGLGLAVFLVLIIIGIIIVLVIRLFLVLIPAVIVSAIVYFLTGGDLLWTGVAFLIVAALSLIAKL